MPNPSTYLDDYEVDIDDYHPSIRPAPSTRPGSSARRYSQTSEQRSAARPVADTTLTRRASAMRARTTENQPRQQPAPRVKRQLDDETGQRSAAIQRQATRSHYSQPRQQPAPTKLAVALHQHQPKQRPNWKVFAGAGMCGALLLYFVSIHIYAWWANTVYDPAVYTQVAHRDVVTVLDDKGHPEQIRVFVDGEGHICELIIPDGQGVSKARIVRGPLPTKFTPAQAQHEVSLSVSASHDGVVTVEASGKITVDLALHQDRETWMTDVNGQPVAQQKGGK